MGESKKHVELVKKLVSYIECIIQEETSSMLLVDGYDCLNSVPPLINGFRPDVYYEYKDVVIIGEAKTEDDFQRKHSLNQYIEFLKYCTYCGKRTTFILCVPWSCWASASFLVKQLIKKHKYITEVMVIDEFSECE